MAQPWTCWASATAFDEPRRPRAGGRTPGRRTSAGSRYSPLPLGPEDRRMKRTLPRELDDLSGMRAARWFRESTAGQWDNFGPDAQREQQDRAIERYGLVDAGLEWSVASSGWTSAWRTATWETMISHGPGWCLRRPRRRLRRPASCATSSRRSSRSRTISIPPASSSSSPTSGCSPRTPGAGTSSSARPTRPRPTAGSCPSA